MRPERYRLTDTHTYFISATSTFGMLTTSKSALPYACWARDKAESRKDCSHKRNSEWGRVPSELLFGNKRERERERINNII